MNLSDREYREAVEQWKQRAQAERDEAARADAERLAKQAAYVAAVEAAEEAERQAKEAEREAQRAERRAKEEAQGKDAARVSYLGAGGDPALFEDLWKERRSREAMQADQRARAATAAWVRSIF